MALVEPITVGGGSPSDPDRAGPPPSADQGHATRNPEVDRILGLTVPCSVILAERQMSIESILGITVGTIVEFNASFDSDLTLYVANQSIAKGRAVKVGENFGLRIDHIESLRHRIGALGGR